MLNYFGCHLDIPRCFLNNINSSYTPVYTHMRSTVALLSLTWQEDSTNASNRHNIVISKLPGNRILNWHSIYQTVSGESAQERKWLISLILSGSSLCPYVLAIIAIVIFKKSRIKGDLALMFSYVVSPRNLIDSVQRNINYKVKSFLEKSCPVP